MVSVSGRVLVGLTSAVVTVIVSLSPATGGARLAAQDGRRIAQAEAKNAPRPLAQERRSIPRRVHVLLCGLTGDPQIGAAVGQSLEELERVLRAEIAEPRIGSFQVLKGRDCNAERILAVVRDLPVASADTVFCYYAGHGAYDPAEATDDPSGGHHFQIPSGDLMRRTLLEQLTAKRPRLTALITDTCNVLAMAQTPERSSPSLSQHRVQGFTPLEKLLLLNRGVVDVSASARDQFSWFSLPRGGWFSNALCLEIYQHDNWRELLSRLSDRTDEDYQRLRGVILAKPGASSDTTVDQLRDQEHLTPTAFTLQVAPDVQGVNPPTEERIVTRQRWAFVLGPEGERRD